MDYLAFDLETIPAQTLPDECRPIFDESAVKLGNLRDRFKIEEKLVQAKESFEADMDKRMSVDPDLCQIVSFAAHRVSYGDFNPAATVRDWFAVDQYAEAALLVGAWGLIATAYREKTPIVTFGGLSFDLPVMVRRSMLLDVKVDPRMVENLMNRNFVGHIDLMQALAFRSPFSDKPEIHSLDYYLKRFNLGAKDKITGADVLPYFKDGNYAAITQYNIEDVRLTAALYERVAGWLPQPSMLERAKEKKEVLS